MKKLLIISSILFFAGISYLSAQKGPQLKINPIPSYNVAVAGNAGFMEMSNNGQNTKERRELNIQTSTTSHGMTSGDVEVWLIKTEAQLVVGHFYMNGDQILTVQVDNSAYSVAVKSNMEVNVSVWFGSGTGN